MTDSSRFARDGSAGRHARIEAQAPAANPARFKLIYESADRRFCLFEDANGHITSVRASKLA